ncbi:MAG: hypothetical protein ACOC0R_04820 [Mariniphaga sp.]
MRIIKKMFRLLLKAAKWTFLVIIVLAVASALYNLTLPEQSRIKDKLLDNEKAYVAETMNLQQTVGDTVWPGWGRLHIPVIAYNEAYAFLIGYPNPPAGWMKMPREEFRGSTWEAVKDDDFFGQTYYRQQLNNPDVTPENFTVKVGEQWVAAMQTNEYASVTFYKEFKNELPPVLNAVFPYKIFWNLLMGEAENYIGGMAHESFHAFQGTAVPHKFTEGENAGRLSQEYPWDNDKNAEGWKQEIKFLHQAYTSGNIDSARWYVRKFVDRRNERRLKAGLSPEMIGYEKNREWLEGLAKYAELKIGLLAEENKTYKPIEQIKNVPGFNSYKKRTRFFNRQLGEVKRTAGRHGESRFYYGGMLQALMLDRLLPGWKTAAFEQDLALDELLKKAV